MATHSSAFDPSAIVLSARNRPACGLSMADYAPGRERFKGKPSASATPAAGHSLRSRPVPRPFIPRRFRPASRPPSRRASSTDEGDRHDRFNQSPRRAPRYPRRNHRKAYCCDRGRSRSSVDAVAPIIRTALHAGVCPDQEALQRHQYRQPLGLRRNAKLCRPRLGYVPPMVRTRSPGPQRREVQHGHLLQVMWLTT